MITTELTADLVHGIVELEAGDGGVVLHRLPARARLQNVDPQLAGAERQPGGARLVFDTAATTLELDTLRTMFELAGVPKRPEGNYDLRVDGELIARTPTTGGTTVVTDMTTGQSETRPGPVGTVRFADLPARDKRVELWLPNYEQTTLVALRSDAPVRAVPRGPRHWLHYGSSISQGSNATGPSTTWVALAAARAGVDVTNLGFSGAAMLDQFVARAMRDLPADVISLEIGINIVGGDVMRQRAFAPAVHGFVDTIRDAHPDVPIVVVSPLYCPIQEHTPGPASFDLAALAAGTIRFTATAAPEPGKLTLATVRDELARVVEVRRADDPNLRYLDGRELYGPDDYAELPMADELHPDGPAHERIGTRFADLALR